MYVSRDKDGKIKGYTRWPSQDHAEVIEEDDFELIEFKQSFMSKENSALSKEEIIWLRSFVATEKAKRNLDDQ